MLALYPDSAIVRDKAGQDPSVTNIPIVKSTYRRQVQDHIERLLRKE